MSGMVEDKMFRLQAMSLSFSNHQHRKGVAKLLPCWMVTFSGHGFLVWWWVIPEVFKMGLTRTALEADQQHRYFTAILALFCNGWGSGAWELWTDILKDWNILLGHACSDRLQEIMQILLGRID